MLLNFVKNGIKDFLFTILAYMHSALQKELCIYAFVEYFNTSTLGKLYWFDQYLRKLA